MLISATLFGASEYTLRIGIVTHGIAEPKQLSHSLTSFVDPHEFSAIIRQRFSRLSRETEETELSVSDTPQVISLQLDPSLVTALVQKDALVADYVLRSEQLDIVIVLVQEPFQELARVRAISFRSDGQILTHFSEVMLPQTVPQSLNRVLLAIIQNYSTHRMGAIELTDRVAGLQLYLDGKQIEFRDSLILIPSGTFQLTASAPGMQSIDKQITVQDEEVLSVTLPFEQVDAKPILVTSTSATSLISRDGESAQPVPAVISDMYPPFVLYATEDGFRATGMHVHNEQHDMLFSLEPEWYTVSHTAIREQREVYASLGRTLVAGALAILFDTLSRSALSSHDLWQPFVLAASGAAAVSFTDTAFRLFAYYRKTQYSSRYWNNEVTIP
jgi:hypothetical protein